MNGELAALISLVLHGNAWLAAKPTTPAPSLERDNTTFRYVHSLSFNEPRRGLFKRERRIEGTAAWLIAQRADGVERLMLYTPTAGGEPLAPHLASAFANGVPRGIVTCGPTSSLWSSRWDTDGAERPDNRIWRGP